MQSNTAADIFYNTFKSKDDKAIVQMLLVPEIIAETQKDAKVLQLILSVTTTWSYTLNRARIKLLGKLTSQYLSNLFACLQHYDR